MQSNLRLQTVEAEITAVMPPQRACGAESQAGDKLPNGPLRAQSKGLWPEYSATPEAGVIRPGICWYPAKRTA